MARARLLLPVGFTVLCLVAARAVGQSPTPPPSTTAAPWEYRLFGGESWWGRLEVRPNASAAWGTVCSATFDDGDARAACRAMNFEYYYAAGVRRATASEQGSASQPVWFDQLDCTYADTRLEGCSRGGTNASCTHSEDVILSCGAMNVPTANVTWEYRLSGGESWWGRLEVRPNASAAWGTVCSDGFSYLDHNAAAACRAVGRASGTVGWRVAGSSDQGAASQPVYLGGVRCGSGETHLPWCFSGGATYNGTNVCSHDKDVMVSCGTSGVPTSTARWEYRFGANSSSFSGRLEVRPNATAPWGTVCQRWFGRNEALAACGVLGLSNHIAAYRSVTSDERIRNASVPVYLGDLHCAESDTRLEWCRSGGVGSCDHDDDVVLTCGSTTPAPPPTEAPWEYRLVGGSTYGRLEVRRDASAAWGAVCSAGTFGRTDAYIACESLGFRTSTLAYRTPTADETANVTFAMGRLNCIGSERRLERCGHETNPDCTADQAVLLSCGSDTVPSISVTSAAFGTSTSAIAVAAAALLLALL